MPASQRRPVLRRNLGAALIALGAISIGTWAVSSGVSASSLDGRVTICRATGHDNHPYERADVSVRSLAGDNSTPGDLQGGPIWYAGAATLDVKWGDIVPPVADVYPNGVNWSEGSRVWSDDCRSGTPPTSVVPATTGCTTTTIPPTVPTTTVPGSTVPPTTVPASTVPVTTVPVTTVPASSTTAPASTVPVTTVPASSTTVPASSTTPTVVPGTTSPGSSVLPPTVPTTAAGSTTPATNAPASSVSPPGPLPTSGSNSLGLLLVGVLLVLLGLVLALTSAHA